MWDRVCVGDNSFKYTVRIMSPFVYKKVSTLLISNEEIKNPKSANTEGERGEERKMNICIRHNVKPSSILWEYWKTLFKLKLQMILKIHNTKGM